MDDNYTIGSEDELMLMDDSELFNHLIGNDDELNHVNNMVANYFSSLAV